MKKLTKREKFEMVLAVPAIAENEVLREFIEHEMNLLLKKNSGEKKPTATQVANEGLKASILEGMESNRVYTIGEIIKEVPACAELSTSKVSALVRQLMDSGAIVRTEDKRKAYFSKV